MSGVEDTARMDSLSETIASGLGQLPSVSATPPFCRGRFALPKHYLRSVAAFNDRANRVYGCGVGKVDRWADDRHVAVPLNKASLSRAAARPGRRDSALVQREMVFLVIPLGHYCHVGLG